jgi:hypothetical protein
MQNEPNGHQPPSSHRLGFVGNLAKKFIDSKLTPLIILPLLL